MTLATVLTAATASAAPIRLQVSPDGNDAWSGTLATARPDGSDGPLRTIPAALARWRALRPTPAGRDGAIIELAAGTHRLESPIVITPAEGGLSAAAPIILQPAAGAAAEISGGRRIPGWQPVPNITGLWAAPLPDDVDPEKPFRSLFVNGERRTRARTPNEGFFRIAGPSPQDSPVRLPFRAGDIDPAWAADGRVEVVAFLAWADLRMYLRSVETNGNTPVAVLSGNPRPSNREANAKYFIENAPGSCDAPGEWQVDAGGRRVLYRPLPGEEMTRAIVMAGGLEDLLHLRGDPAAGEPVRHVIIRGLAFRHTDWSMPENGFADTQAAVATRGDLLAEWATDCVFEDNTLEHLAGYGIELGRGCQRFRIVGNSLVDLGGGGIRVGETAIRTAPIDANHSHTITDNLLRRLGRVYAPAVGMFLLQTATNRVAHNHIHDLYYTAVSVGWNWGYNPSPCRENVIEFNHMHDIGQKLLSDMGAVYTLGPQSGTIIRNNVIHDVEAFTYGGWGLYPDEGSTGIVWENNLVYRCKSAGFHQHYGRDNIVRNNIFAFNREHQLMRTREEEHRSFSFTNNIVLFSTGALLGSNWKNNRFTMDRNLYWDTRLAAQPDPAAGLAFGRASLAEWQQRGHDLQSRVADPRFVAPDRDDFRLQPDSPALALGFKPFDPALAGIRPKAQRKPAPAR